VARRPKDPWTPPPRQGRASPLLAPHRAGPDPDTTPFAHQNVRACPSPRRRPQNPMALCHGSSAHPPGLLPRILGRQRAPRGPPSPGEDPQCGSAATAPKSAGIS
jgi:hypothetical protein